MHSKTKIYVDVIIVIILTGGLYYNWQKNNISLPIDSKNEAIAYAKTDADFSGFIDSCESRSTLVTFNNDIWLVRAECTERTDSCYDIRFKSNGTITDKGYSCFA